MTSSRRIESAPVEVQDDARRRVAVLTSNILNPFLLTLATMLLLSFASAASMLEALKWASLAIGFSVLPVFVVILYFVRHGSLEAIFSNIRQERTKVYVAGCVCAILGAAILYYLGAPSMLVGAFATGLAIAVVFMGINLWWKISLHTALVAVMVTVLMILYGRMAIAGVSLVALTAWARMELDYHSLAQTATGALIAALIVVVVFSPFVPV